MTNEEIRSALAIIHMRAEDGWDRNAIAPDMSPYKTRAELAARNHEHYRSLANQVAKLMTDLKED